MRRTAAVLLSLSATACEIHGTDEPCPSVWDPREGAGQKAARCGDDVLVLWPGGLSIEGQWLGTGGRLSIPGSALELSMAGSSRGCAVAWHGVEGVMYATIDPTGSFTRVLAAAAEGDRYNDVGTPAIGFDGSSFVLTWRQTLRNVYGVTIGSRLLATRIRTDGATLDELPLTLAETDGDCSSFGAPQVAQIGDRGAVAWMQQPDESCSSNGSVYLRTLDEQVLAPPSLTTPLTAPFELVSGDQLSFAVTGGASGLVVAWHDGAGPLVAQSFDPSLSPLSEPLELDGVTTISSDVAGAGEPGRFAFAWDDSDTLEGTIRARVFDTGLGELQELGGATSPSVASVPGFRAAWYRPRRIDDCDYEWEGATTMLSRDAHGPITTFP